MRLKPKSIQKKPSFRLAAIAAVVAMTFGPTVNAANLICERTQSTCVESAARISPHTGWSINTPVIYNGLACWKWSNTYSCVDAAPTYKCSGPTSGPVGTSVLSQCAQVGGTIASSVKINNKSYVTDGNYQFLCEFPTEDKANPALPTGKDCVRLETRVSYKNEVLADLAQVATDVYIVGSNSFSLSDKTLDTKSNTDTSVVGDPATVKTMDKLIYKERDIKYEWVCYDPPVEICTDTCFAAQTPTNAASTSNIENTPVACTSPVPKSSCVISTAICDGQLDPLVEGQPTKTTSQLGPDGRCVSDNLMYHCAIEAAVPCNTKNNCTLVDSVWETVSEHGLPLNMEQTYECTTTETQCDRVSSVNSCNTTQTWGLDKMLLEDNVGEGLADANVAMAKVEGIQKGMSQDDVFIFSGKDLRCRYPVGNFLNAALAIGFSLALAAATGGTSLISMATGLSAGASMAIGAAISIAGDMPNSKAFGTDCCESEDFLIKGSDKWYKMGSCTAAEVKLAVARGKQLAHKIGGDYCSKRRGFPIRQCKQKTKTYCAFDDMLALTVNLEGRAQLDRFASAAENTPTSVTSTSADITISRLAPTVSPNAGKSYSGLNNGAWAKVTTYNGTDIYSWQYPAYCLSLDTQKAAYAAHVAEVDQAVNLTGYIPPKDKDGNYILTNLTPAQGTAIMKALLSVPSFQECSTLPGSMAFMTCSTGTNCDTSKFPPSPNGVEFDADTGNPIGATTNSNGDSVGGEVDLNWRIQEVRSFYEPGGYGVTENMPSNSSFAKVSNSISEAITASGSCKESSNSCLYNFSVTAGDMPARMLVEEVKFPLYSLSATEDYPTIDYMPVTGEFNLATYMADSNAGLAAPIEFGKQRFIFHPNLTTTKPANGIHQNILMEWAYTAKELGVPSKDYTPLSLPTNLPEPKNASDNWEWWPKVAYRYKTVKSDAAPSWQSVSFCHSIKNGSHRGFYIGGNGMFRFMQDYPGFDEECNFNGEELVEEEVHFYISGGCDEATQWCSYTLKQKQLVERHPWGTNKSPRCWGFSLDQMAALDFSAMDLSRWINSLDLDGMENGMSSEAKTAMAGKVTATAQNFYNAMSNENKLPTTVAAEQVLVLSSDTLPKLSGPAFESYKLKVGIPANWPKYYTSTEEGINDNRVTRAVVRFGRDEPEAQVVMVEETTGTYSATADLGDYAVGTYKIVVTVDTQKSGQQVLSQYVRITPYDKANPPDNVLDFNNTNINAVKEQAIPLNELTEVLGGKQNPYDTLKNAQGTSVNEAQP